MNILKMYYNIDALPLVSVIMPVYNSGVYLETAVDSILSQSLREIELILVDDGSTDGSSEKCDEYARRDSRVIVIHQKNEGICNARNAALKIARGEYIAFSDHDDEYLPGLLEDNYKYAKENNLDFVKFCKKWVYIRDGKEVSKSENHISKQIFERCDVIKNIFWLLEHRFCSCVWDTMFNRLFLTKYDIVFDPYFKMGGEDYAFNLKCFEHVNKFGTNDKIYYYHIIHENFSTSSKFTPDNINVIKKLPENVLNVLKAYNVSILKVKNEYSYFYIMFYFSPTVQALMKLPMTKQERYRYLDNLKTEHFYFNFIENADFKIRRHKYYYFIFYLRKYRLYGLLFMFYRLLK